MDSIEDFESIQVLHQYQYGLLISKVMFTASELGVFDLLLESGEPLSSGAIAERLGTSPSGMERLLEACVGLKFLRMERKENRRAAGTLAKECISLYPNSTAIVFDLPEVVESLKKDPAFSQESWMTFQTGDFFKDPVPEADLYILARILHSWNDEKCIQLLTKLHKACKPGGGVLVVELVLDEDKCGPPEAHLYSMLMLLHSKGKERTSSEYQALFTAAGFKEIYQQGEAKLVAYRQDTGNILLFDYWKRASQAVLQQAT
nr:acetylserotonin O-methyltransferase-like [Pogona vitticeps]